MIPLTAAGPYLTAGQAARRLGVNRKTLGKWSRDERLPCIRTAGGHRRYLESDVEAALADFNVPPAQRQRRREKRSARRGRCSQLGPFLDLPPPRRAYDRRQTADTGPYLQRSTGCCDRPVCWVA